MVFIKITVLFKKNPAKKAESPDDLEMREMNIRADVVRNVYNTHPSDESVMAKAYVVTDHESYTVLEDAEEILDKLADALEKWKKLP